MVIERYTFFNYAACNSLWSKPVIIYQFKSCSFSAHFALLFYLTQPTGSWITPIFIGWRKLPRKSTAG
jgi:hypothetical protein